MTKDPKPPNGGRRGWRRWHFFAIVAAGVAIIGGIWGVLAGGAPGPAPTPGATPSASVSPTR